MTSSANMHSSLLCPLCFCCVFSLFLCVLLCLLCSSFFWLGFFCYCFTLVLSPRYCAYLCAKMEFPCWGTIQSNPIQYIMMHMQCTYDIDSIALALMDDDFDVTDRVTILQHQPTNSFYTAAVVCTTLRNLCSF